MDLLARHQRLDCWARLSDPAGVGRSAFAGRLKSHRHQRRARCGRPGRDSIRSADLAPQPVSGQRIIFGGRRVKRYRVAMCALNPIGTFFKPQIHCILYPYRMQRALRQQLMKQGSQRQVRETPDTYDPSTSAASSDHQLRSPSPCAQRSPCPPCQLAGSRRRIQKCTRQAARTVRRVRLPE